MESNIEHGKLFVGGLSWETTSESLKTYFENYGEVDDSVIMKDQQTGNPRGFGFVQFKESASVDLALRSGPHILDKKTIDPKQATAKGQTPANISNGMEQGGVTKKVFIGGVPTGVTEEDIKKEFQSFGFGNVTEVTLKVDKNTSRMRGFGFVTFEDSCSAANAVKARFVTISDKKVEIKAAEPRFANNPQYQQSVGATRGSFFGTGVPTMQQYSGGWNTSRNFSYAAAGYPYQTAQQPQYSGTTSGQYAAFPPSGYAHNSQQYPAGYGAAASAAAAHQRYPYEYSAGQQHGYPQDTSSYGTAANPTGYTNEAYSNAAAGYGYTTDQTNSYHHYHDQPTGVASTAGYPARAAQTQQRVTAGAYNNFGATR